MGQITSATLTTVDPDTKDINIIYQVYETPKHGAVINTDLGAAVTQFSQADVNSNKIRFNFDIKSFILTLATLGMFSNALKLVPSRINFVLRCATRNKSSRAISLWFTGQRLNSNRATWQWLKTKARYRWWSEEKDISTTMRLSRAQVWLTSKSSNKFSLSRARRLSLVWSH